MTVQLVRGDAAHLPLTDSSVDLIVTSPPYFALRSYQDTPQLCQRCIELIGKDWLHPNPEHLRNLREAWPDWDAHVAAEHVPQHYAGQIGSEGTPGEWVDALIACTAEWVRVLKPSGSLWVNLGDKYANPAGSGSAGRKNDPRFVHQVKSEAPPLATDGFGIPAKSLMGLPWRYALRCIDQLGLILRAEVIWSKPNGLPESVTDRVRRSHEQWFHFTVQPRYYAAVDTIREPQAPKTLTHRGGGQAYGNDRNPDNGWGNPNGHARVVDPLGKLPGSVWSIPSQPLTVPKFEGLEPGQPITYLWTDEEAQEWVQRWPGRSLRPLPDHFACVDEETEILTTRGWLRHRQLEVGDSVAGYDLDSNTARWTNCSAIHRYHHYDAELVAVESRDLSMRLTPNHRTIVQRMETRSKRRNPVHVVRADELDRSHFIPRSADWQSFGDFHYGARAAAMMGWVAAEGWYQGRCVYLSQSLTVNAAHVAEIDKLIPGADCPALTSQGCASPVTSMASRSERQRVYKGTPWTDVTWRLGDIMATIVQQAMPDKLLPWWLVTSTEEERRAVLGAFIAGDGHRRTDGRIGVYQKHRHNLDVLQAVAVTLGYKTTLSEGAGRFVLYLTEGGRSVTLRGTSGVGSKVRREEYTGLVWCPTTDTGTFIARRNGSVFVTGNSFPMEWPRRIIQGWSPSGICTRCGEGRRPVTERLANGTARTTTTARDPAWVAINRADWQENVQRTVTGECCACTPHTDHITDLTRSCWCGATPVGDLNPRDHLMPPPTRPAVVLDPFGGTGTTALMADVLGRHGITVDLSADYSRLARWRTTDPGQRAQAMQVDKPEPVPDGQLGLFEGVL